MLEFSNLLEEYADKSPYNHVQLAKLCGINRSLLQKIFKGDRKPQSREQVITIADVLMLTAKERNKLLEAYEILKIGRTVYYQRKTVNELIFQFSELAKNESFEMKLNSMREFSRNQQITVVNGNVNVTAFLQNILYMESMKTKCQIRLFMPGCSESMYTILGGICSKTNVYVQQLIGLSQMRDKGESNNVQKLIEILPMLFGKCHYQSRYYYENQVSGITFETAMCNYILLNNYCIAFNSDLKNLIVYDEEDVYKIYEEHFKMTWDECRDFATHQNNVDDIFNMFDTSDYMCIQGKPCLVLGFTKEFLKQIANFDASEEMEAYIDRYMERIEGVKSQASEEKGLSFKLVINKEGCIDFMEKGYLCEFPENWHKIPVQKKDRAALMHYLCYCMKKGYLEVRIAKEEYMRIDKHIHVDITSHRYIYLSDSRDTMGYGFACIVENSIVTAFCDYYENYLMSERVYTLDESIQIIEDIVKLYAK